MWNEDRGKATLVDPEGQVHTLRLIENPKKWKIKYASGNTKPAELVPHKAAKLSLLQRLIRGEKTISHMDHSYKV